jgi:hypothetical protein
MKGKEEGMGHMVDNSVRISMAKGGRSGGGMPTGGVRGTGYVVGIKTIKWKINSLNGFPIEY